LLKDVTSDCTRGENVKAVAGYQATRFNTFLPGPTGRGEFSVSLKKQILSLLD
jgi:hypothetical protein